MTRISSTQESDCFAPSSGVVSRVVGDETVLVDLDGEIYFSLNHTGSLVWQQAGEGRSLLEIVAHTAETYSVAESMVSDDVTELIEQLIAAGLLTTA